jgi:UDP-glucose 4-epimerase
MEHEEELSQYRGLNVIVTGGAGFIGSHLVKRLAELGANVTVIDNYLKGNKLENVEKKRNIKVYKRDVTRYREIAPLFRRKHLLFHLAAVVGVEETQSDPLEVLDVEIEGTINVLKLAVKHHLKRIIFASSSEVYGDSEKPMVEDDDLNPKSTYAVTKLVVEDYCKAYYKRYGLDYTLLRYFNSYGPWQDKRFVISRFIEQCYKNKPIIIYGDGKQTRDFTYIDDSINMTLIAAMREETKCQAINIGTGVAVSIKELADLTTSATGNKSLEPIYMNYGGYRPLEIEIFNRTADITRAKELLDYEPTVALKDGIQHYIDWYIKERNNL